MKYKQYQKYKDSGVEWIGEIPEHWEVSRIKFYFNVITGKTLQGTKKKEIDIETPYISAGDVLWEKVMVNDLGTMWATPKEIEKYQVKNGDLLVCEGGEAGRSAILNEINGNCITQNHVHIVRPKNDFPIGFLLYVLEAIKDSGWFETITKRVSIPTLPNLVLGNTKIPIPSTAVQNQIYKFLKKETRKIDNFVEKIQGTTKIESYQDNTESLPRTSLSLINEKRQVLITSAVTGKIDVRNSVDV